MWVEPGLRDWPSNLAWRTSAFSSVSKWQIYTFIRVNMSVLFILLEYTLIYFLKIIIIINIIIIFNLFCL